MIINKPINIDANNVSIGNVKIKWEVGKAYRTRGGARAIVRRQESGLVYVTISTATGSATYYCVCSRTGKDDGGDNGYDIVGPWEDAQETGRAKRKNRPIDRWVALCEQEKAKAEQLKQGLDNGFATWDPDGAVKAKYENPNFSFCVKCTRSQLILAPNDCYVCAGCGYRLIDLSVLVGQMEDKDKLVSQPADADLYDYKNVPAKKDRYVPHDYAGAHLRDINTPDNRRPRVSLRTAAQIAHERAVLRLRQHKLARWGLAESVRWEDEEV